MLRLHALRGNDQRLDGGAMFGNAPRAVWQKWCAPDQRGRISLACRAMLVDEGNRKVLFETGIGTFFEPALRERFGVTQPEHVLLDSLAALGLSDRDIDVVVLSHLHFDHAGGLLSSYCEGKPLTLLFPNATYVASAQAVARARQPHARDKASFIPELLPLLEASGRLHIVDSARDALLGEHVHCDFSDGHTPGMLHATVRGAGASVFFAADLIPGVPWVHTPITMGYDRFPERLIDEKAALLERFVREGTHVFFTHDFEVACARVLKENGRFRADAPHKDADGWLSLD